MTLREEIIDLTEDKKMNEAELRKGWEEFKALAKGNPDIEEVGNLIFTLNYDNQAKEILEGQRRYREQMNTQYTAGYTDAEEKYQAELADKDAALADKDATIASLQAELAKYKAQENK